MKKIKKYYRVVFELVSPLSVGSGEGVVTDSDVLVDGRGIPYVPGSALAGVYRGIFARETAERYFGKELTEERIRESSKKGKNLLTESKVLVYDAVISNPEKRAITTRDMVALDEYKVSIDGAKFDFQVLEPGVRFVTYIEQNMEDEEERYVLYEVAKAWGQGKIRLGAKTGRGYGQTRLVELAEASFELTCEAERDAWLDFDMYGEKGWTLCELPLSNDRETLKEVYETYGISLQEKNYINICLGLKQCGAVSVRQYSTNIGQEDYRQMERKDKTVFIPGTTWAGVFRAQMGKLDKNFAKNSKLTETFYGTTKGSEGAQKTRITFSETVLENGRNSEKYTRNSIDRFSGGAVNGSLYTEKSYFDGTTELNICCDITDMDDSVVAGFARVLAAAILDLDRGYMSIGGLTAVGHGIFKVMEAKVNGQIIRFSEVDENEQYQVLKNAIFGEEEQGC